MNSPDAKLESLFAMLAAVGHLKSYKFPVVQMAMGNTISQNQYACPMHFTDEEPSDYSREAEEFYMQFRVNHP
jgi:hypothetical protein